MFKYEDWTLTGSWWKCWQFAWPDVCVCVCACVSACVCVWVQRCEEHCLCQYLQAICAAQCSMAAQAHAHIHSWAWAQITVPWARQSMVTTPSHPSSLQPPSGCHGNWKMDLVHRQGPQPPLTGDMHSMQPNITCKSNERPQTLALHANWIWYWLLQLGAVLNKAEDSDRLGSNA